MLKSGINIQAKQNIIRVLEKELEELERIEEMEVRGEYYSYFVKCYKKHVRSIKDRLFRGGINDEIAGV